MKRSMLLICILVAICAACQPTPAANTSAPTTAATSAPTTTPNTELTPPAEGVLPFDDGSAGDPAAVRAVEAYLTAKVAGDRDTIRDLLCTDMEANLDRESLSFTGVNATLEGLACTVNATNTTVTCQGNIVAEYDGENRPIPLSSYRVVNEDGVWRWCGEAE